MTNNDYQEMVAFLGRKFDEVDRRFDQIVLRYLVPGIAQPQGFIDGHFTIWSR